MPLVALAEQINFFVSAAAFLKDNNLGRYIEEKK